MKVTLPSGRVVKIGTKFGNERPKLERPLPAIIADKPFRSVQLRVTLMDGDTEKETVSGESYCNPLDQFDRIEGRKKAMKRLFGENRRKGRILTKQECKALAPVLMTGHLSD